MKNIIRLGESEDSEVTLDIEELIDTRMVIQANSGGGKSYFLRLVAERAAAAVPFILLDYEGEFSTLREKVDLVLVGADGEIAADTRSAKLLARKLIETEVSAVIDLYGLRTHDRQEYARIFLDSLINLPQSLWRPYLIFIDEAHKLCPEKGDAKATSTQAVIDLMSMGGKRGFCGVLATQRFSKLHNNALAEANNFFIGRTVLDNDQKRAGDYLGMTPSDRSKLRDVEKGHFFTFGPALSFTGVGFFQGDRVATTHLRGAARRQIQPPKPSRAIQKILTQFADLPQQAEEEARSLEEARARIAELRLQVKKLEREKPAPVPPPAPEVRRVEVPVIKAAELKRFERAIGELGKVVKRAEDLQQTQAGLFERFATARDQVQAEARQLSQALALAASPAAAPPRLSPDAPRRTLAGVRELEGRARVARAPAPAGAAPPPAGDAAALPPRQQKILDTIAEINSWGIERPARELVAFAAGRSSNSGGFNNDMGQLHNSLGLISYPAQGLVALTEAGRERARAQGEIRTRAALHAIILRRLEPRLQKILQVLIPLYPQAVSREDLAASCQRSSGSGGWNNDLGRLRNTLQLVEYPEQGMVRASAILFPEGLS